MARFKMGLAVAMGAIIGLADIYWAYTSYFSTLWLALAVVIFAADLVWLWVDIGSLRNAW